MATLTGDLNSTQYEANYGAEPQTKVRPDELAGRVRRAYAKYDLAAADTLDANAVLRMFKLPKGATIVDANIVCGDMGTTGDFVVGWDGGTNGDETADPNGIFTTVTATSAVNSRDPASTVLLDAAGWNKRFDDEVTIEIDITTASDTASAISFELEVYYIVD